MLGAKWLILMLMVTWPVLAVSKEAPILMGQELEGYWQTEYEIGTNTSCVVYHIHSDGKLMQAKVFSVDQEKQLGIDILVVDNIKFTDEQGSADYVLNYNGEVYRLEATLTLVNERLLTLGYSYYGFQQSERWLRVTPPGCNKVSNHD